MRRVRAAFASLGNRNFRLFFAGETISATGTWMQKIGQAWLVLELTGSGTLLGVVAALQHLPTLLFGVWGGLVGDRVDKRRLLVLTQTLAGSLALLLGALTGTGLVELWMVFGLALALGCTQAFDRPARKAFVIEMVGSDQVTNAITLTSVVRNAARSVGPAVAGVLIAQFGLAASFYLNALSYGAVVVGLLLMHRDELSPAQPAPRERGQLRAGFRHVRATPGVAVPLLLMAVAGLAAYEWSTTLPLFARDVFGGGPETFGLLFSAMGAGAVVGGLGIASLLEASSRTLIRSAVLFSGALLAVALAPNLAVALTALFVLGGASMAFKAQTTALVQLRSAPHMRGRVTALLTVALAGTTPIGGPLVGWIGEHVSARSALAFGAVVTGVATFIAAQCIRRQEDALSVTPTAPDRPTGIVPGGVPDGSVGTRPIVESASGRPMMYTDGMRSTGGR